MEYTAYYKNIITDYYIGRFIPIYFKINKEIFVICFYCFYDPFNLTPYCGRKLIGNKIMQKLIRMSKSITIKNNLSNYVFDIAPGKTIDFSNNKKLISTVLDIKKQVKNLNYKSELKDEEEIKELYKNIWK
jgi:hypothetical protein